MKKCIILFFLFEGIFIMAFSQRSEFGMMAGISSYLGDLNDSKPFAKPQVAGGFLYRYNFSPRWAVRANVLFANVKADDYATNKQYERNLSFRSPITEIGIMGELNFFNLYNKRGDNRITPYIFGGFCVFSFRPQAELNGKYYDLQHLGTEGQGLSGQQDYYKLTSCAVPFGIGVKVTAGKYLAFSIEWGFRATFTDYLDDVSGRYYDNEILRKERGALVADLADRSLILHQAGTGRGNVATKDFYTFLGACMTLKFGNEDAFCNLKSSHNFYRRSKWR
jgi:hypothetical protein